MICENCGSLVTMPYPPQTAAAIFCSTLCLAEYKIKSYLIPSVQGVSIRTVGVYTDFDNKRKIEL